ncbi:MAG: hypothetical protein MCS20_02110, partial [Candidatus Phytoplasma mali]|nr:hypothetical protein [Candidatus Phytoplasma australiense]MCG7202183.1 hypothetical protein [Candidatus Phytoplasma mali]
VTVNYISYTYIHIYMCIYIYTHIYIYIYIYIYVCTFMFLLNKILQVLYLVFHIQSPKLETRQNII